MWVWCDISCSSIVFWRCGTMNNPADRQSSGEMDLFKTGAGPSLASILQLRGVPALPENYPLPPHCVDSISRSSGVDFKEFRTFTSSAFNRLDWNNAKLIWVYIAVNKSLAYIDPHNMTVMHSMQVEAINRIRLLPLLVCTRIQTSPKHQVPLYSWPETWRILYSQQPYYYGRWLWAWLPRNGAVNRSISCWRIDSDAVTIRSLLPVTLTTGYVQFLTWMLNWHTNNAY